MVNLSVVILFFASSICRFASEIASSQPSEDKLSLDKEFLDKGLDIFLDIAIILHVMTENYKKALHEAREELVTLLGKKEEIDKRVAQLRQTVDGLAALCGEEPVNAQPNFLQSEILRTYENILETFTGKP